MDDRARTIYRPEDFPSGAWLTKDGRLAVVGPTWQWNPKRSFESFSDLLWRRRGSLNYGNLAPESGVESYCKTPEIIVTNANKSRRDPIIGDGQLAEWFKAIRGARYYAHYDLSKTRDRTSFTCGHYDEKKNIVVIDMMLAIEPKGNEIQIDRMRQWCKALVARGFDLRLATYDGWGSVESIQVLNREGIRTELFSVDRDTKAYDTFLELLLGGRLDYYYHPILEEDFRSLVLINGKRVDHRAPSGGMVGRTGSKDLSDSVAAVCYHCVTEGKTAEVGLSLGPTTDRRGRT